MSVRTALAFAALVGATPPLAAQKVIYKPGDPGVEPPAVVTEIKPSYTPAAMQSGVEGTVLLTTVVDTKGRPQKITVTRSLERSLDQKATAALGKWRFTPAMKDGRPVDYELAVWMTFDLRGGHRGPVYDLPDAEITPPTMLVDVKPRLPSPRHGAIKLQGIVETDGSVSSVRVLGTTDTVLNVVAMEAFLASRFKPATRAGIPVACRVEMEYTFQVR